MSRHHQILTRDGQQPGGASGRLAGDDWSIAWTTLHGGVSEGVQVVTLSTGTMSVDICPTRGMGVLSAECGGTIVGWKSPNVAPVHPQFVNLKARNGLGWLDGFNELLCRCGLSFNGPPGNDTGARSPIESDLTLHGTIANTPAHTVEVGYDEQRREVWIRGECRESTLFGPHLTLQTVLKLPLDGLRFHIADTITNHASTATELELLYHINVGPPFLEAGARFHTAFREMSPRDERAAEGVDTYAEYLGPTAGYAEQVYFYDTLADETGRSRALLRNHAGNLGLSVVYDRQQLPCLSQWKCTQPDADGYVTGIEPGTNYPNFKSTERECGRVVLLEPQASYQTALCLEVHPSTDSVAAMTELIALTQGENPPVIHAASSPPMADN